MKNLISIIKIQLNNLITIFAVVCQFCVLRFDYFRPGLLALLEKERSLDSKKEIIQYTLMNLFVFKIINNVLDSLLGLTSSEGIIGTAFFVSIGLIAGALLLIQNKIEGDTFKMKFGDVLKVVFISMRIFTFVKFSASIFFLIAKIPVVGPLAITILMVIALPFCFREIARFFREFFKLFKILFERVIYAIL